MTLLKLESVRPGRHRADQSPNFERLTTLSKVKYESQGSHTSEKTVQLHQNLQVNIVTLGRLAMGAAHMVTVQVDTYIFDLIVSSNST